MGHNGNLYKLVDVECDRASHNSFLTGETCTFLDLKEQKTQLWSSSVSLLLGNRKARKAVANNQAFKWNHPAIIWVREPLNSHVCNYIEYWFGLCQMWFKRSVAVDSVLLMQSGIRFAHITFQCVSPFLCVTVAQITMGTVWEHVEHSW